MKRTFLASLSLLAMAGMSAAETLQNDPAVIEQLKEQNPFKVVDQLHDFTYAELDEMYPQLSDVLLQSLMYRIVESMKRTPIVE
ncbi:hypothetical protein [Pelagibacterium luteolum]|uniref:Uncharacterized protein n=1 Tax=Pelagibacterium luteolum TaxID=440168 RepID=A0A1G7V373_9HYPH|nr:hypothetical protein [Pelagibacterium luteolum]SDG53410.1 hypothetical protein SAMN04487974_103410 [Pelagibacterium luteolum]